MEPIDDISDAPLEDPIIDVALEGLRMAGQSARREGAIAETLQRSLLRENLPEIPGLTVAARYVAGASEAEVGGDWYDLIPLHGGQAGIVIGDVVGRGIAAAARMGHLQSALRAYALEGHSPGGVLERMNEYARAIPPRGMATLVFGVVDPAGSTLTMASAGHPPPLIISPDGGAKFIGGVAGSPLGVARFPHIEEQEIALDEGATVVLYTDGVIEAPTRDIGEGMGQLRRAAAVIDHSPSEICDRILTEVLGGTKSLDDVALLAVRLDPVGHEALTLELAAEPESVATVRHTMTRWLRAQGADEDEAYEILVACGEACTNAIEHAYAPDDATFRVEARSEDGAVEVVVTDTGSWRPERGPFGGRGLQLMRALVESVTVDTGAAGTSVTLRHPLRSPVTQ